MECTYLQIFGRSARANGQSDGVFELMDDQIQVNGLFPINVGVTDGQFSAVMSKDLEKNNSITLSRQKYFSCKSLDLKVFSFKMSLLNLTA